MNREEYMRQMKRLSVERRPEACLGCGMENSCSVRGCAVMREALRLEEERQELIEDLTENFCETDMLSRAAILGALEGNG